MIEPARIQVLREVPLRRAKYVLYWMQASQRTRFNHALEYAIQQANELKLPLVVCFGLMDDYPEANARHYAFLLQGLRDVHEGLAERGIRFVVKHGPAPSAALHYAKEAAMVVCDRGYTRHQKRWRDEVADAAPCRVVQVETDAVVPVEVVSDKVEFAARTIRPKIHKHLPAYLKALPQTALDHPSIRMKIDCDLDVTDPEKLLPKLKLDTSVGPIAHFIGGQREAQRRLKEFVAHRLKGYAEGRNEPGDDATSHMSPYLHFGNISPLEIALAASADGVYIEELIVRRELSLNFVNFHPKYDQYECLPAWAQETLRAHARDQREFVYRRTQLEQAKTHDRYWNAAQKEMTTTGFMHNYMRMYWGKKILEWSDSPKSAYETTLYLNNKYFFDGRDPNSFAGVAWIYGLHDRPWTRRPIFGTIRYMNAAGLERKFDMDAYVDRVARLAGDAPMQLFPA